MRSPYRPYPCFFLSSRARNSRQASNALVGGSTRRSLIFGGSGSSLDGRRRQTAEDGLRRRHFGQGHLCVAGHCVAVRGEAAEEEGAEQGEKMWRRGWGLRAFYRPLIPHLPQAVRLPQ